VLAHEYGFAEDDGTMPAEFESLRDFLGEEKVPEYWKAVERFAFTPDAATAGGVQ